MPEMSLNGVDVGRLNETMDALRADASLAQFEFRAHNQWMGGGKNETELSTYHGAGAEQGTEGRCFVEAADEPEALLGEDTAPNPVEHLLTALATCMTTTMAYHAAARGIHVEDIEADLKGELDLRGFLGIAPGVRPGYSHIDVHFTVTSDAAASELAELAKRSPVYDVVSHGTDVNVHVDKRGARGGHRIHPHDDEDVSQAFGTGDSEWQRAAGDGADRDPTEGAPQEY